MTSDACKFSARAPQYHSKVLIFIHKFVLF
uniref:Uncharacterized protein n=1 Tax=Anguilla anguilla TaxID=7936 RepID=A0A0E9SLS7_ANGAN